MELTRSRRTGGDPKNRLLERCTKIAEQPSIRTDRQSYSYAVLGNFTNKSDVSATAMCTYGTQTTGCGVDSGPHAVSHSATTPTAKWPRDTIFCSSRPRTYTWTTYNKPSRIAEGTATVSFSYGADRSRFKQVNSATGTTTLYIGGLFEKRTTATATTEVHYIQAGGRTVAVHTSLSSTAAQTRYLHGDHLGSVVLVTDEDGNVEGNRYSFDAFGRRRNGSDWTDTLTALSNPDTTLGYTGHESIDAVDIVHMNGRVYDPYLGRVLSPDPIVQAPHNGQSLNRYSYVMNNPLSYTDPSGYRWEDDDMDYGDDPWWCSWWCDEIDDDDYHGGGGGGDSYTVRNAVDPSSEMDTNGATPMEALRAMVELIRKDWKAIYRDSTRRAMEVPGAAVFGDISGVDDLGEAVIGAVEGNLAEVAILGA